ncbi:MAG: alpha/beta fold hydrolase [Eubacteriales bacterium]
MSYQQEQTHFPSSDGKNQVAAYFHFSDNIAPKGIVQLSHGMVDYVRRYDELSEALAAAGYVFCGNDHLGHGHTAQTAEDLGYFAPQGGVDFLLQDLHRMTELAKSRFPGLPVTLLGHSMGSFLCRLYATRYGEELANIIIQGTSGPNRLLPFAFGISALLRVCRGERYRSPLLQRLTLENYNRRFGKSTPRAWLSRDTASQEVYRNDPHANFTFTVSAFVDLFTLLRECNRESWFAAYPKHLRTLLVSGAQDPVGTFGKGPLFVARQLWAHGAQDVQLKLYPGARHELFKEENKDAYFRDLITFLDGINE